MALLVFAVSLYDMFLAAEEQKYELQVYVLLGYGALAVLGLLLYLGYKPVLSADEPIITEEVEAAPPGEEPPPPPPTVEEVEEAMEIVEVPRRRATVSAAGLGGRHTFRCPFCSHLFGLEASHVDRTADFRMSCPYCSNGLRIPRRPKVAKGRTRSVSTAAPSDQLLYSCANCGEVLRFTAPGSRLERTLLVNTCPHCQSRQLVPATPA